MAPQSYIFFHFTKLPSFVFAQYTFLQERIYTNSADSLLCSCAAICAALLRHQVRHHLIPCVEACRRVFGIEVDGFAGELVNAVLVGTVIDEVVAMAEVFVVREDDAFVEDIVFFAAEVFLHPRQLVVQSGGVLPRGGGEDIDLVLLSQFVYGLNGARHRVH